jgi:hypothetical protein
MNPSRDLDGSAKKKFSVGKRAPVLFTVFLPSEEKSIRFSTGIA